MVIKTKIASGIFWAVLMRWSIKFIGLINTVILARLLLPEDFGLVAMAMLIIGLIEELSTLNIALLLIRGKGIDRSHSDTAWTVGILQGFLLAGLLVIFAPFAASYFGDERVVDVVYVLAILKVVTGFKNVGVIIARKELDFTFDYKFMVYTRVSIFFTVLGFALVTRDYWAIVWGSLIGEIISVLLSYTMHSYRPRWCTTHIVDYFRFAIPMIPMAIAKMLNAKFDVIVVGGRSGTATMGIYNVANELASIMTVELIMPAARGLFPNYALLAKSRKEFMTVYIKAVAAAATVCIPICIGVWLTADEIVYVLLGEKWMETAEYVKWLVFFGAATSIITLMAEQPLIALGMERWVNVLMWLRLAILVGCVLLGYHLWDIKGIAIGMAVSGAINLPIITLIISRLMKFSVIDVLRGVVRPGLAGVVMFFVIEPTSMLLQANEVHRFIQLLCMVSLGVIVYVASLFVVWRLAGKPDGLESFAIEKLKRRHQG